MLVFGIKLGDSGENSGSSGAPRGRNRDRSRSVHSTRSTWSNKTNNIFNGLKDNAQENELMQTNDSDKTRNNVSEENRDQRNTRAKVNHNVSISANVKVTRPPPITFKYTDIMQVRKLLTDIPAIKMNTTSIRITEHGIKVQLSDEQQYDILIDTCKKCDDVLFYTHTKKQERQVKFCLYGLWKMDIKEIDDELKSLGITARDIEEMPIYERKYNDQCIYKLTFLSADRMNVSKLRQIRFLFSCSVRWQYFKGRSFSVTRCTNCQEWGHGEKNCFSVTKCSRCAGNHKSSECPHVRKDDDNKIPANLVKCANCGGNHTAGFSGCRAKYNYEIIQQRMRENARINSNDRHNRAPKNDIHNFPHTTQQNQRFVEAPQPQQNFWHNRQNQMPQQKRSTNENLLTEQECLNAFDELLEKLPQCQTKVQQIRTIGAIVIKFVYGGRP